MANDKCKCPCCEPDEETTLLFTIKEVNQALKDNIINVSYRYADDNGLKYTDIVGAIPLIPDKFRTPLRILTFFRDEQSSPEIWMYTGKSSMDWEDLSAWVRLYKPNNAIHGGYSNTNYSL